MLKGIQWVCHNLPPFTRKEAFCFVDSIKYDRPYLSVYEQIQHLKQDKHLNIDDEIFAAQVLSNISYYTLVNGFKNKFTDENEIFNPGVKFSDLYRAYLIDGELNAIILKSILFIERQLKSHLAHIVARDFGVYADSSFSIDENDPKKKFIQIGEKEIDGYLSYEHYQNSDYCINILKKLKRALIEPRENSTTFYYKQNHNHIPPWILVNDISFGTTILWFRTLPKKQKQEIANAIFPYSESVDIQKRTEILLNMLQLIAEYRNLIAHGNRTFTTMISYILSYKDIKKFSNDIILKKSEYKQGIGKNDLYAVVISILFLTNLSIPYNLFKNSLHNILIKYESIQIGGLTIYQLLNIPENIIQRIEELYKLRKKIPESSSNQQ